MKTILVPTDFSDAALYALKVAASISRKIKGRIILVHVYNLPASGLEMHTYIENYYQDMEAHAEAQLERLAKMKFLRGIPVEKYLYGDMFLWQVATSDQFKEVDLIVMGSHGISGFNKVFIGSNTEKVVRLANVPVLTIKHEIEQFSIKKLVFASNFKEESRSVFEKIQFFADLYKSHIYLLKIITPREFEPTPVSEKMIRRFAKAVDLDAYSINIYNAFQIEQGIIDFSEQNDADLIAIETHGRTGFAHLINGSLTEDLIKHEPKPVLSIKIQQHSPYGKEMHQIVEDYKNWGSE